MARTAVAAGQDDTVELLGGEIADERLRRCLEAMLEIRLGCHIYPIGNAVALAEFAGGKNDGHRPRLRQASSTVNRLCRVGQAGQSLLLFNPSTESQDSEVL